MAIIEGGILGRVRGSVGGVKFSSARGRIGKLNTAMEKVIPANPNTPAQQTQRGYFKRALIIDKGWGPDLYKIDWNRSVGQLPGFQSIMNILLINVDESGNFNTPSDVPLGDLHIPDTVTVEDGMSPGSIKVTWSTEAGDNGTAADKALMFLHAKIADSTKQFAKDLTSAVRSEGVTGISIGGLDQLDDYQVGFYLVGQGDAEGTLANCKWSEHTAPN